MEEIKLSNHILTDAVLIPSVFVEHYMPKATGEQVKVYLYLLRQISSPHSNFSLKTLAAALFMEEDDVRRALSYWGKQGLLEVEVNDFIVTGITFLPIPPIPAQAVAVTAAFSAPPSTESQPTVTKSDSPPASPKATPLPPAAEKTSTVVSEKTSTVVSEENQYAVIPWDELEQDTDYQGLLRSAQAYLGTTLKPSDCDRIAYWYVLFERSSDLVEYLIEYCADLDKTSFRYMEKVALDWHQRGLKTLPQVKEYSNSFLPSYNAVMRGMGIKDRSMSTGETELFKKWIGNYHFPAEILQYACERTIQAIHAPSFGYADTKLTEWFQFKLNTLDEIRAHEKKHDEEEKKKKAVTAAQTSGKKKKGQFFNFDQRDTDYNEYFKDFYDYSETAEEES